MRRLAVWVLVQAVVVTQGCRPAEAQTTGGAGVVRVRVYNYARAPQAMLTAAGREAERIFAGAGLSSHWRICRIRQDAREPDDPACEGSAQPWEVALRIVPDSGPADSDTISPDVLGYAVIGPDRTGVVATVLFERVSGLGERRGMAVTALLGRVMAHEVGHLLLGSSDHGRYGLMRARWVLGGSEATQVADWRFTGDEATRMRSRISRISSP
jgi:hypothetical protein